MKKEDLSSGSSSAEIIQKIIVALMIGGGIPYFMVVIHWKRGIILWDWNFTFSFPWIQFRNYSIWIRNTTIEIGVIQIGAFNTRLFSMVLLLVARPSLVISYLE